jgi:exonuclease III
MQHHLLQHDVVIILETKMRAGQDHHLPECLATAFTQHIISRPATVGCGGGLLVLVRNSMAATLTVRDAPNGVVWIRVDTTARAAQARSQGSGRLATLHILGCYLPPAGSAIYGKPQVGDPWDVLQQHISRQLRPGEQLLLLGDFNARTGGLAEHSDMEELQHALPDMPELAAMLRQDPLPPRRQADAKHNEYGKQLLSLLAANGCCIFNGRCPGDNGGYTS